VSELSAHLIQQSVTGNVVLADNDAKPAAVVMLIGALHTGLLEEFTTLRGQKVSFVETRPIRSCLRNGEGSLLLSSALRNGAGASVSARVPW
jgi:hypothetical protein